LEKLKRYAELARTSKCKKQGIKSPCGNTLGFYCYSSYSEVSMETVEDTTTEEVLEM
jgi:hypothetical protein